MMKKNSEDIFSRCAALFLTSLKYEILRSDNFSSLFLYSAFLISFVPYSLLKMLSKHLKHIISLAVYAPTPKDGDASEIDFSRHRMVLPTLNSLKDATLLPSCDNILYNLDNQLLLHGVPIASM